LASANIEIERNEPFAIITERVATFDTHDSVPDAFVDLLDSIATWDHDLAELAGDRVPQRRFHP
jgi:hypothetical protein